MRLFALAQVLTGDLCSEELVGKMVGRICALRLHGAVVGLLRAQSGWRRPEWA